MVIHLNKGLQVKAYGSDVMVTAYDYKRDKEIKKLLISDSKIAQMAPNVTADDSKKRNRRCNRIHGVLYRRNGRVAYL